MLASGCENSPHDTNFTVSALAAAPPMRTTAVSTIAALKRLDFENISTHTLYEPNNGFLEGRALGRVATTQM